jgi:hypothetical protein
MKSNQAKHEKAQEVLNLVLLTSKRRPSPEPQSYLQLDHTVDAMMKKREICEEMQLHHGSASK